MCPKENDQGSRRKVCSGCQNHVSSEVAPSKVLCRWNNWAAAYKHCWKQWCLLSCGLRVPGPAHLLGCVVGHRLVKPLCGKDDPEVSRESVGQEQVCRTESGKRLLIEALQLTAYVTRSEGLSLKFGSWPRSMASNWGGFQNHHPKGLRKYR